VATTLEIAQKGCALIPAYNEGQRIAAVVRDVQAVCPNVVVVDDGSPDDTASAAKAAGAAVLVHDVNSGKGAALNTGFQHAREMGYEFVVTLDGDGQHAADDIPGFIEAYAQTGAMVVIGNRMADTSTMPAVRRWTNRFMSWLLSRKMGQFVPDTQNGFRLYKTDVIPEMRVGTQGFSAESEILLELAARGVKMGAVPIKVIYGDEKSKIHPLKDAMRFFNMLREYDRRSSQIRNDEC
jgi:glycosyltransferase involved in cell wall biosynthesis